MGSVKINIHLLALFCISLALFSCSHSYTAPSPLGKKIPQIEAQVLNGEQVILPDYFNGQDSLMLIGFVQESQFDVDRWILALKQLGTPVRIAEIPAILGFVPWMFSQTINQAMKDGIPAEDWPLVFTVYKDASTLAKFVGNTKPLNVRVLLLDKNGAVLWFHDRGYSADFALELDKLIRSRLATTK